jgi:glucokinase
MEYIIKKFIRKKQNQKFKNYIMGIDIGGTNTNFGIAGIKNLKPNLLFRINFKTKNLNSIIPAINKVLTYTKNNFNIEINIACIGAAGIVTPSHDYAKLTNVKWDISSKEITNQTSINLVDIINDFQSIGFGINLIKNTKNEIFIIRNEKNIDDKSKATKVIIGAGTGFGKSILIYNEKIKGYIPIPSEGGHGDLPIQNNLERELVEHINKIKNISQPISYEEVLSGRGLENIYSFLRNKNKFENTEYTKKIDNALDKPTLISKYKKLDKTCKETFRLFTNFYARCAKNYILDTYAIGGLYIAGGIAAKNKEIFTSKVFLSELENSYKRKNLLKNIPISIILNYDLSLYGACYAAIYKNFIIKK